MRERNDECLCTVPLFCFLSVLPLEKDMFVAPVHSVFVLLPEHSCMRAVVSVHTQFTTLYALAQGCVVRKKKKIIAMSSMFAPAHFSCSPSTPLTLTSSSSIPSSRTSSQVKFPINKHCATPPNEESGPLAKTTSSTGPEELRSRILQGRIKRLLIYLWLKHMISIVLMIFDDFGITVVAETDCSVQCTTVGTCKATPIDLLRVGSACSLGIDPFAISVRLLGKKPIWWHPFFFFLFFLIFLCLFSFSFSFLGEERRERRSFLGRIPTSGREEACLEAPCLSSEFCPKNPP